MSENHADERRERVPIIRIAIEDTVSFVNRNHPYSVKATSTSAILTVNAYFLLNNAYRRARHIADNRVHEWNVAAFTAASIMAVRPIRFMRTPDPQEDLVRFANWDCATRASGLFLNLNFNSLDPDFVQRFHRATLGPISLTCLSDYFEHFDRLIFMRDSEVTFDEVEAVIPFKAYDNIELRGRELLQLEQLLNVYQSFSSLSNTYAQNIQQQLGALSQINIATSSIIIPDNKIYEGRLIETVYPVWNSIMDILEKDWSEIYRIPPDKLEELVAMAYKKDGYDQVILTKRSGDDGRDVIAIKTGRHSVKIIGSVKRYARERLVPYDDVRALLGVLGGEQDASKALFVTTSDFPVRLPSARFIKPFIPTRLELMNGTGLREWLMKHRTTP